MFQSGSALPADMVNYHLLDLSHRVITLSPGDTLTHVEDYYADGVGYVFRERPVMGEKYRVRALFSGWGRYGVSPSVSSPQFSDSAAALWTNVIVSDEIEITMRECD